MGFVQQCDLRYLKEVFLVKGTFYWIWIKWRDDQGRLLAESEVDFVPCSGQLLPFCFYFPGTAIVRNIFLFRISS